MRWHDGRRLATVGTSSSRSAILRFTGSACMARSTFSTSLSITHAFEMAVFSTARSVTLPLKDVEPCLDIALRKQSTGCPPLTRWSWLPARGRCFVLVRVFCRGLVTGRNSGVVRAGTIISPEMGMT
jgi:hypothetical protein